MSVWRRLTAGGAARRALGVSVAADGPRRVGVDGAALVADAPADFAPGVSVGVVPDAGALLRRLALPPAKAAVTDRLVRQQVASWLPGMDGRLAIAWRRDAASGAVTVAAAPRAALRAAADGGAEGGAEGAAETAAELRGCDVQVPAGLALDALLSRGMSAADPPAAWAVDTGGPTWLLLYADGGLIAADAVGPGEAVPAVFADLTAGLEPGARPAELNWVGPADAMPGAGAEVTCVRAAGPPPHTGWAGGGADPAAWLAAGAALIGRQAREAQGLDLEERPGPGDGAADAAGGAAPPRPRRRPGRRPGRPAEVPAVSGLRWAVVGLWLLGALGLWAWAVATGGARQAAVLDELGLSPAAIPALDRGLAVGRYLETSGPSVLAVLDELGQKTERWLLDELTWERDSGLTLRGTLGSADAVAQLAQSMAAMRTLTGVQVRRQRPVENDDDKVTYTITASPSAKFFGAFVEPRKPATGQRPGAGEAEPRAAGRAAPTGREGGGPTGPRARARPRPGADDNADTATPDAPPPVSDAHAREDAARAAAAAAMDAARARAMQMAADAAAETAPPTGGDE